MAVKFKKGDKVIVISGADKGKQGDILSVIKSDKGDKVVVSGVKIATIHKKRTANAAGQIVKVEKPIDASNVAHLEGSKAVKVGFTVKDGKKLRVSKKTGDVI